MAKAKPKPAAASANSVRDRVKEFRRIKASELVPNQLNWRQHPPAQAAALKGLLAEVGFAGAAIAREDEAGRLVLIDGHLRAETLPDQEIPVLVLDVTEEEANKLLAAYDPLGAMASADAEKLDKLLADVLTDDAALRAMFAELQDTADGATLRDASEGNARPQLKQIQVVRAVFAADCVEMMESAIAATGINNRAEAFAEICRSYLREKGQLNASPQGAAQA